MIPISLSITGFLSYHDTVEIDFTAFDLACIAGRNGAGKSSILDAITWVLFGQARQRGDAIINNQSDSAEVRFVFQYEDNMYRVQRANPRGKTGMLEFAILRSGEFAAETENDWKPLSERTIRETQERIEETLRLDYETFVNAAFFLQGKADQFTQQRAADRKRILASILGLEIWETYRKRAVERRKAVETHISALEGRLTEINAELSEEDARKARLRELNAELARIIETRAAQETALEAIKRAVALVEEQRKGADQLAQRLASAKERMDELNSGLAARKLEQESYTQTIESAAAIEADYGQWQQARQELIRWDSAAEQFREHDKRRQEPLTAIETERARLLQEQENLQEQQSALSEDQKALLDLQAELAHTQQSLAEINQQFEQRKSLEDDLQAGRDRLAAAQVENPHLKAKMESLKARIDQLSATDGAVCPLCGQALEAEDRQRLIDALQEQGQEMGDTYRANQQLLAETDELVADLKRQVSELGGLDEQMRQTTRQFDQTVARIGQIEAAQNAWAQEGQPRLDEIQEALRNNDFALEARAVLVQVDAELKEIGYDAAAHDAARRTEQEGRLAEEAFRELEKARAAFEPLQREIAQRQDQIAALQTDIEQDDHAFQEAQVLLKESEESAPDLRQAQHGVLDMKEKENQLRMEVGAAQQKVQVLDDLRKRRKDLEAERAELAKNAGQYKQLETAFGKDGVPALLIEQALPQIESRANDILDRLSGGEMSIRFETQRELKTRDDLKETLDIRISDSAGGRDYELYSGGEAFRVNFAIRLALSEMLAQRAGARLRTLVIDEGFGSQDEIGRQRLLEAINLVKTDFAKILVITHIDALKDAFPARIEVEKTERGSVVTLV